MADADHSTRELAVDPATGLFLLTCLHCAGQFSVKGRKRALLRKFCGPRCQYAYPGDKKYGKDHHSWRGGHECKACGCQIRKGRKYCVGCTILGKCSENKPCLDCGVPRKVHRSYPTLRCRPCALKRRKGHQNSNWKGGITQGNKKIRASDEYRAWRVAVFERDNYTCVWCGQRGGRLNADHIKPFAKFPELRLELSNGRTLCVPCHRKTDSYLAKALKRKPSANQPTFWDMSDPGGEVA